MLKSLYPGIEWDKVKSVGFDIDGTLYDEVNFIAQVYYPIAEYLAPICDSNKEKIYKSMLERWVEKGSSYQYIFDEILIQYTGNEVYKSKIINNCLHIYRNFTPILNLPKRSYILLDYLYKKDYALFLVTDGNCKLQNKKIVSLGLKKWFKCQNIGISGCYGSEFQKPSTLITKKIPILSKNFSSEEIVYFGDRETDKLFALNCGFQFVEINCLFWQRGTL